MKSTRKQYAVPGTFGAAASAILVHFIDRRAGGNIDHKLRLFDTSLKESITVMHLSGLGVVAEVVFQRPVRDQDHNWEDLMVIGGEIELDKDGSKINEDLRLELAELGFETDTLSAMMPTTGVDLLEFDLDFADAAVDLFSTLERAVLVEHAGGEVARDIIQVEEVPDLLDQAVTVMGNRAVADSSADSDTTMTRHDPQSTPGSTTQTGAEVPAV